MLTVFLSLFSFLMYAELSRVLYRDAEKDMYLGVRLVEESLKLRFLPNQSLRNSLKKMKEDPSLAELDSDLKNALAKIVQSWESRHQLLDKSLLMMRIVNLDHETVVSNLKGWEQEIIFPNYERDAVFMELGYSYQTIHFEEKPIRLYYHLMKIDDHPLLVIQSGFLLFEIENTLSRLRFILMVAIPVVVFFSFFAGWFLAKRFFKPVDNMIEEARHISAAYLNSRLPRTFTKDELDRLAGTLNEMMDRIEFSTRAVREFSSDVSHELKTPLAIIRGELDLAFRRSRTAEELEKTLKVIGEEVNEMIRLVNDLMILVRSDSQQLHLEKDALSIKSLLNQIYMRFTDRAKDNGVQLTFDAGDDSTVFGDEVYLKRMFSNLVDNAIKFTNEEGSVHIQMENFDKEVLVTVKDTGIGIEPEVQAKVFSRFFRGERARAREGSGLGLSIVKAICEAHDGVLSVQSQPGVGTAISIRFPVLDSASIG